MINPRDLILPAFYADALSLGPHWIYNPGKIKRLYPEGIQSYDVPRSNYHPGKSAGDLTHYGEQMLALLGSIAHFKKDWNTDDWRRDWLRWTKRTQAYMDGASKSTVESIEAGSNEPSDSNDLAGASRIPPLFALYEDEELVRAARSQTALTHGDPQVIDAAEFFVRATQSILDGSDFDQAFDAAASFPYDALPAIDWLSAARGAVDGELDESAACLGLTCHVPEAFPLTIALALRFQDQPVAALSANAMIGGDSAARGTLLGMLMGAKHGQADFPLEWFDQLNASSEIVADLELLEVPDKAKRTPVKFPNPIGDDLDAIIDFPAGPVRAFALFAHCFTCGKNLQAARSIGEALAQQGIATLRFDFTGLGASGGDFSDTSFLTNLDDLVAAAGFLRDRYQAPSLLIGHSLGGSAMLAAASRIVEARGIVTIGAPADPAHVTELLGEDKETIARTGKATVSLAGRRFTIGSRFLDDFAEHCQPCEIAKLNRDLLIFHAPKDMVVGIENAQRIYEAAKHPKSFYSLAEADHLLSNPADSRQVARVIAAWADRLIST